MNAVQPISVRRFGRRNLRQGFTLMEAAIVTVIVGVGIVAMMQLLATGTLANATSAELTTAMGLSSNIHEMSLGVAYDSIMTLDGYSKQPPVDAKKNALTDASFAGWKQLVRVDYVDPNNLTSTVPKTQTEPTALMTCTVSHNGKTIYIGKWLTCAGEWP